MTKKKLIIVVSVALVVKNESANGRTRILRDKTEIEEEPSEHQSRSRA